MLANLSSTKQDMTIDGLANPRKFIRGNVEYLVSKEVFWSAIGILFAYILYSFSILSFQEWPDSSCSSGDLAFPFFFVVFPMWTMGHALLLRLYEQDMEPMSVFYNCCLGFIIALFSIILALWISTAAWSCSNQLFLTAYILCMIISVCWVILWAYAFTKRFISDELSPQNTVSYLLVVRCACIPTGVRKTLAIVPFLFSAFLYSVQVQNNWNETCHAPLNFFSFASVIVFLLLALITFLILIYGRTLLVSSTFHENPEDNAIYPMIMTILWYGAAAIDVFSMVWATIGAIWLQRSGECHDDIKDTAFGCIISLYLYGIFCPLLTLIFRIETCFPSPTNIVVYSRSNAHSRRMNSDNELLQGPSTHSMATSDRGGDTEMGSDLDLRRGFETQIAKKKRKKMFKTGKYLWNTNSSNLNSNNNINSGSSIQERNLDSDSLLYPSGTVSADVVHHSSSLSSSWTKPNKSSIVRSIDSSLEPTYSRFPKRFDHLPTTEEDILRSTVFVKLGNIRYFLLSTQISALDRQKLKFGNCMISVVYVSEFGVLLSRGLKLVHGPEFVSGVRGCGGAKGWLESASAVYKLCETMGGGGDGNDFGEIVLRRSSALGHCVNFHLDCTLCAIPVVRFALYLNDDEDYDEGRLVFALDSGALCAPRVHWARSLLTIISLRMMSAR
eukprot:gene3377-6695_t